MHERKKFGPKNFTALALAFCLVVQSVMVNGNFMAFAASDDGDSIYTDRPEWGEAEAGGMPVGDTDYIGVYKVGLYSKDGVQIEIPNDGDITGYDMTDSIFVRYHFKVKDEDGTDLEGKEIQFYIPDQIGIHTDIKYKIEQAGERFASVSITKENLVTITLLASANYIKDVDAYIELETFWKSDKISNGGKQSLDFPMLSGVITFPFDLKPVDVTALVTLTKEGTFDEATGRITWKIKVSPSTQPITVPVRHIMVRDKIDAKQTMLQDTFQVYPVSGQAEKSSEPMVSYMLSGTPDRIAAQTASGSNAVRRTLDRATWSDASTASNADLSVRLFLIEKTADATYQETDVMEGYSWDSGKREWTFDFQKVFAAGIAEEYFIEFQTTPSADAMLPANWTGDADVGYKLRFTNKAEAQYPLDGIGEVTDGNRPENPPEALGVVEHPISFLGKDGTLLPGEKSIAWEVSFNQSKVPLKDVSIADTLPEGLELDPNSVIYVSSDGTEKKLELCSDSDKKCIDSSHFTYKQPGAGEANGGSLNYYAGGSDADPYQDAGTLKYETVINDNWYSKPGGDSDFENRAVLTWTGVGSGGKTGVVGVSKSVPRLHKWIQKETVGEYDETTGQITWQVILNGEGLPLTDVVFTDDMGTGENQQIFVDGSLAGGNSPDSDTWEALPENGEESWLKDGNLYKELGTLNETRYLQFKTKVETDTSGGNWSNRLYSNTAGITGTYNGGAVSQTARAEQLISSSTLEKKALGYDYQKREITWELVVNNNRMKLENAAVIDKLPKHWKLIPDSVEVKLPSGGHVDADTAAGSDGDTVTFKLPSEISDTYDIIYKTKLTDEGREAVFGLHDDGEANNGEIRIENQATLTSNNGSPVSVSVFQNIQNNIVKKTPVYEQGDDFIKWRVVINQNQTNILAPGSHLKLTDDLKRNGSGYQLNLDIYSVKLYQGVEMNADGSLKEEKGKLACTSLYEIGGTADHTLTGGLTSGNVQYQNRIFTFDFSEGDLAKLDADTINQHTFVLEFCTDIIVDENHFEGTITNDLDVGGLSNSLNNGGNSVGVAFTKGSGGSKGRKGILTIEKVDQFDQTIKLEGAMFDMLYKDFTDMVFSDGITVEQDGRANVEQISFNRDYILNETEPPKGYVKHEGASWEINIPKTRPGGTLTLTVENRPKLGWMDLVKKTSTSGSDIPLEGAKIGVYEAEGPNKDKLAKVLTDLAEEDGGSRDATGVTGADGKITIEGLRCGSYYFKEMEAPEGYLISSEKIPFVIEDSIDDNYNSGTMSVAYNDHNKGKWGEASDQTGTPVLKDDPYGKLTLQKTDLHNASKKVRGAAFSLYRDQACSGDKVAGPVETGADGTAVFDHLTPGTYWVKEEKAAKHYRLESTPREAVLVTDGNDKVIQENGLIITNEPAGTFTLKKYENWDGRRSALKDAEITLTRIKDQDGMAVTEAGVPMKTDANGQARFDDLSFGTYEWKETAFPPGYVSSAEKKGEITVSHDNFMEGVTAELDNTPISGSFQVKKTDKDGAPLPGARFAVYEDPGCTRVYKFNGSAVEAVTDTSGIAVLDNLRYRNGQQYYYCKEIEAPDNYEISRQVIRFQITDDGVTVEDGESLNPDGTVSGFSASDSVVNYPTGSAKITKVDSREKDGAHHTIVSDKARIEVWSDFETDWFHDSICGVPDCPHNDKYHYHDIITSDNGVFDLGILKTGNYKYREVLPPDGYLLDKETVHNFTVNQGAAATAALENRPLGAITIQKYEKDTRTSLRGAGFTLYEDEACTKELSDVSYWKEGTVPSYPVLTDDKGYVEIPGLLLDQISVVYIKETAAPKGYLPDAGVHTVTFGSLPQDSKTQSLEVENAPVLASFVVQIVDTQADSGPVEGADISLYRQGEAVPVITVQSGSDGMARFENIRSGSYYVKETKAPDNGHYLLNDRDVVSFQVTDDKNNKTLTANEAGETIEVKAGEPVAAIQNVPVGRFTLTKEDGENPSVKLEGVEITLTKTDDPGWGPQSKTTDTDGAVVFEKLQFGAYEWKETGRPAGYFVDEQCKGTFTVDASNFKNDSSRDVTLKNEKIKASIQVKKVSSDTKTPLGGAEFILSQKTAAGDWSEVDRKVSDYTTGTVLFTELPVGDYQCKESVPPHGYKKSEETLYFRVSDDPLVHKTVITTAEDELGNVVGAVLENEPVGSFSLTKVDSTNPDTTLQGARIKLVNTSSGSTMEWEKETGSDGRIEVEELPYGIYTWEETAAPDGYIKGDTYMGIFEIRSPGQAEHVILKNRPLPRYTLKLEITGEPGGRPLAGVVTGLYDRKGNQVGTTVSGGNGVAEFRELVCSEDDNYYYMEITPPKGYEKDTEKHWFHLADDGIDHVQELNETLSYRLSKGSFHFWKVDSSVSGTPIAGAVFELTYAGPGVSGALNPLTETEKTRLASSGEDGKVVFDDLPLGEYECREVQVPKEYHLEKDWSSAVRLTADNPHAELNPQENPQNQFINYGRYYGALIVQEKDAQGNPLEGGLIGLYLKSNNVKIGEATTGADGKAEFSRVYEGDYYYKEMKAPESYALDQKAYEFSIVNNGETIEREMTKEKLLKGSFLLTKTGDDNHLLPGAVIGLYRSEDDMLIAQAETDRQGIARFDDLDKDEQYHYYYRELEAPEGYVLDQEKYPFEFAITEEGQTVNRSLANYLADGRLILKKTDPEGSPLSGAVIGVYQAENGEEVVRAVTDANGMADLGPLKDGSYFYQEIEAPEGYLLDTEAYKFSIEKSHKALANVMVSRRLPKGSFLLAMTGEDGRPLSGVLIGLYRLEDQSLIAQAETDRQGIARFDGLEKDEQQHYYYRQLRVPEGYILDGSRYPLQFSIAGDGEIVEKAMASRLKRGNFQLLKVRDETKEPLKGAVIAVYNSNGDLTGQKETDQDGSALFTGLELGDYYYEEIEAPTGYVRDKASYPFVISVQGETVTMTLENKKAASGGGGGGHTPLKPSGGSTLQGPGNQQAVQEEALLRPGIPPITPETPLIPVDPENPATWPDIQNAEVPQSPPVETEADGTQLVTIPQIPAQKEVIISDSSNHVVFRGVSDSQGRVHVNLEPGQYTLIVIDDEAVPLGQYIVNIDDGDIPTGMLPRTGDRGILPSLCFYLMSGCLLGTYGLTAYRKKKRRRNS